MNAKVKAAGRGVRRALLEWADGAPRCPAVLLSSGSDSCAVLFALLRAGKSPRCYSFQMEGHADPFDARRAREVCAALGLEHVTLILPRADLLAEARTVVLATGQTRKVDVECFWPVARSIERIPEAWVVTGHAGDGHYCLTKKAVIALWKSPRPREDFAALRAATLQAPNYMQVSALERHAAALGKRFEAPWLRRVNPHTFDALTWAEANRPQEKGPTVAAFADEFAALPPRKHSDLHAGGSGVKEAFASAFLNAGASHVASVAALFRAMLKGRQKLPVLVGESPSRTSESAHPLSGHPIAGKLARLCGVGVLEYLAAFDRWNLLTRYPGHSGNKGALFPRGEARARAADLTARGAFRGRPVLFLGSRVADAFGFDAEPLTWNAAEGAGGASRCAVLPHPSGVNRWWNDAANARRAEAFMRRFLNDAGQRVADEEVGV